MKIVEYPERSEWKSLIQRPTLELDFLESTVNNILHRVKKSGDAALRELTSQLDHVQLASLQITKEEVENAAASLPEELKSAITIAASNIEKFHIVQRRSETQVETMPGVVCWRKEVPISRIGIYIPGGSAPLFSTVLMLGIPARAAGCEDIILCTPPAKDGTINPAILFAAQLAGVSKIFKVGGAQAIAALAYGTESIPAVDKIFGPGNQYVTKAKLIVNQQGTAIDMPAGPSEVLVIADEDADPEFVAADLLSQAEHGADSQVVLVTKNIPVVNSVLKSIAEQVLTLPRKEVALRALEGSLAVVLATDKDVVDFSNAYAPEHLIINTSNCDLLSNNIINAGSVFLGPWSPESAGDYASGTNHTLPTNGFARAYSGISLESFTKVITFQKLTAEGIQNLGPVVEAMATAEQLHGHKESISVRLKKLR